ncbi:MAG TPA: hypothetical protein VD963_02460, partial [Phycisphaerales bacterium]|nr:hypothetical protein [Phycisphaerales bacterium]
EPYANTDWTVSTSGGAVTWSSPQTFAQNPNSNALRWGTMYNFWFVADAGPGTAQATLGLFKPHTPSSVAFDVSAPVIPECPADFNQDGLVSTSDISSFLSVWFADVANGTTDADFDGSGATSTADISAFLSAWFAAVGGGC